MEQSELERRVYALFSPVPDRPAGPPRLSTNEIEEGWNILTGLGQIGHVLVSGPNLMSELWNIYFDWQDDNGVTQRRAWSGWSLLEVLRKAMEDSVTS